MALREVKFSRDHMIEGLAKGDLLKYFQLLEITPLAGGNV